MCVLLHAACFSILFSWIWRIYQGCPASLRRGSTCFCTAWCSQRHRHLPGGSADWPRICGILWLWPSWWGTWGSKFYTSTLVHSKKKANPQIKRPCNIQYPSPWRVWCFEAKTIKPSTNSMKTHREKTFREHENNTVSCTCDWRQEGIRAWRECSASHNLQYSAILGHKHLPVAQGTSAISRNFSELKGPVHVSIQYQFLTGGIDKKRPWWVKSGEFWISTLAGKCPPN